MNPVYHGTGDPLLPYCQALAPTNEIVASPLLIPEEKGDDSQ